MYISCRGVICLHISSYISALCPCSHFVFKIIIVVLLFAIDLWRCLQSLFNVTWTNITLSPSRYVHNLSAYKKCTYVYVKSRTMIIIIYIHMYVHICVQDICTYFPCSYVHTYVYIVYLQTYVLTILFCTVSLFVK